jgi:hypothetical protein
MALKDSYMQICITQREGIRYFSRFKNIPERDRLEVELTIEGSQERVFNFDLTDVLLERFAEHPEILGKRKIRDDNQLSIQSAEKNNRKISAEVAQALDVVDEPTKRTRVRRAQLADEAKVVPKPIKAQPTKKSEPVAEVKPIKKARSVKVADVSAVKPVAKPKSSSVKPKEEPKTIAKKTSAKPKVETSAKAAAKTDKKVAATARISSKKVVEAVIEPRPKRKAVAKPVQTKTSASAKTKVPVKPKNKTTDVKLPAKSVARSSHATAATPKASTASNKKPSVIRS